jgi:prolyl-tRNA editing enzyme YbaK/EbsC (Cys-tRNA(Pro) deacylase)
MALARFLERISAIEVQVEVHEMEHSTHTAEEAAAAVGCAAGAIVKSLLFLVGEEPLLVLTSGVNRVDTSRLTEVLGSPVAMADPKAVKAITGYSIGGVPPFGHVTKLKTIVDEDLLGHDVVWAAAGAATAVFPIPSSRLVEITGAEVARVAPTVGVGPTSALR